MILEEAEALAAQLRDAVCTEADAWRRLQQAREQAAAGDRTSALEQWQEANRRMCEAAAMHTAWSMSMARESLRMCAEALVRPPQAAPLRGPCGEADAARLAAAPALGQALRDRHGARWQVIAITRDEMEPNLFLAQLQKDGEPEAVDVYCEDWMLFCVVHGLRVAA